MTARQLRDRYFEFFKERDHVVIPSASLIPEGDSSTLFISAGMHPLVPYLLGEAHPSGKRLCSLQKCLRTGDIDNVGDGFHHTFFEMLGNWSLGDYWKKEAISWSFEFLEKVLRLDIGKINVSCFAGDKDASKDEESFKVWQNLGIPMERIFFFGKKENWWGPVGQTGPCGPDTEMFVDTGKPKCGSGCDVSCQCGKYVEIWNDVFMEYEKKADGNYRPLKQKNVDTGMGLERVTAIINGYGEDDYRTKIFWPIIETIQKVSGRSYEEEKNRKPMRIIADHIRAAVFVITDGVIPGNKERGYVLRRLIRRSIRQGKLLGMEDNFAGQIAKAALDNKNNFGGDYPELTKNEKMILDVISEEENEFRKTLDRGLKETARLIEDDNFSGLTAFNIYQTYGFPLEMIIEEAEKLGKKPGGDFMKKFNGAKKGHQELSRTAAKGKFKSGLANNSEKIIKYHTATHLLQAALREILGDHVQQVGSNITEERLRFDFTHPERLTDEEIKKTGELINERIKEDLPVKMEVMSFEESQKQGALAFFNGRYPAKVKVYSIGGPVGEGQAFSKEVCAGPHLDSTGGLGSFKIIKEESCGGGKRRIYAVLGN